MACLHLDGETPEPDTDEARGYQQRGYLFEDWRYAQLCREHGEDQIERQVQIQWDHGVCHADFLIKPTNELEEHKSRSTFDAKDSDWLQLAGNLHFSGRRHGWLTITHPSSLEQRRMPFELTEWWRARVVAVAHAIGRRHADGLPNRICAHPTDARQYFCKFAIPCFDDWTPPDPLNLPDTHHKLALELWQIEAQLPYRRGEADALETRRDEIRDQLKPLLMNGADYMVPAEGGQIRVRCTTSKPRVTYDVNAALSAGAITPDQIGPFTKHGKPSSRWTVDATGSPAVPDNEPPF